MYKILLGESSDYITLILSLSLGDQMFELFNTPMRHQLPIPNVTGWNQARNMLNGEYVKLERFHRSNISFIPNNHVLVSLLNTEIPSGTAPEVAMALSDAFDNKMTQLGIGSPYGRPDFSINSWFYNKRTYEILLQDSSMFDADEVYENWQDARPIRVLHHPFNDISFAIPNGKYISNSTPGYAVITINPAMLLLQFKGYMDYCKEKTKQMQAPAIFLSQYPIFNMLKDHIDIAIRNRLVNIFDETDNQPYRSSHAIGLNNPTPYVDAALNSVIKNIGTQPYKFNRVLELIPAFTKATQRETTPYPINAITHYTGWIYNVARAPVLDFLIRYGIRYPNYENNDYINDIKRSLKEMEMDRSIPNNASPLARHYVNSLEGLVVTL